MNFADLFQHEERLIRFASGRFIVEAEHPEKLAYVLISGEAEARCAGMVLKRFYPGELFGEMALIDDHPSGVDVVAVTECALVPIDGKRFCFLVQQTPNFAIEVMKLMAERLREMNRRLGAY